MIPESAADTAYYLNSKLPALALIGQGVRFPKGQWIRIAGGATLPWHVEELMLDLFPVLRGKKVASHVLLTDFDVAEFERRDGSDGSDGHP